MVSIDKKMRGRYNGIILSNLTQYILWLKMDCVDDIAIH